VVGRLRGFEKRKPELKTKKDGKLKNVCFILNVIWILILIQYSGTMFRGFVTVIFVRGNRNMVVG